MVWEKTKSSPMVTKPFFGKKDKDQEKEKKPESKTEKKDEAKKEEKK